MEKLKQYKNDIVFLVAMGVLIYFLWEPFFNSGTNNWLAIFLGVGIIGYYMEKV